MILGETALEGADRRALLGALAGALLAPAAARAQAAPQSPSAIPGLAPPGPTPEGEQLKLIGGSDLAGRLVAKVKINGEGPFRFVVDSGANTSVISDGLATRLGLPPGPPTLVHGIAGAQAAPTASVKTFKAGPLSIPVRELPVLKGADLGAEGLLGIDAFVDRRMLLDLTRREVRVELSRVESGTGSFVSSSHFWSDVTIHARQRAGQLTIIDAEAASGPVTCFIDTGAQVSVGNAALYRRMAALNLPLDPRLPSRVMIVGATGQQAPGKVVMSPLLRLGGVLFRDVPLVFADLHTFELWGLNSAPALLVGMDLLRLFELVIVDFGRRQVTFRMAGQNGAFGI